MPTLTKAQRAALKRVYDRAPLFERWEWDLPGYVSEPHSQGQQPVTYRQFRKLVQSGYDCVMLPWCGMWLGIEKDGYTHS